MPKIFLLGMCIRNHLEFFFLIQKFHNFYIKNADITIYHFFTIFFSIQVYLHPPHALENTPSSLTTTSVQHRCLHMVFQFLHIIYSGGKAILNASTAACMCITLTKKLMFDKSISELKNHINVSLHYQKSIGIHKSHRDVSQMNSVRQKSGP